MDRVVGRLPADFDDLRETIHMARRALDRVDQAVRLEMIGARA